MEIYLTNLLMRMSDDSYCDESERIEGRFESIKTVAWKATEEARQLNKVHLFDSLYTFVNTAIETEKRQRAYFIIGSIASNSANIEATIYLIAKLKVEKKGETIDNILRLLQNIFKPATIDIEPILKLTEHHISYIRWSSYLALTNTGHNIEPFLRDKLKISKNKEDILSLMYSLKYVGTEKALVLIEPHIKNRTFEMKFAALEAMAVIMLRNGFSLTSVSNRLKLPIQAAPGFNIEDFRKLQDSLASLTRPG